MRSEQENKTLHGRGQEHVVRARFGSDKTSDTELFLLGGSGLSEVIDRAETLSASAATVPLGALSAKCFETILYDAPARAALIARDETDLRRQTHQLKALSRLKGPRIRQGPMQGTWLSSMPYGTARVGLAFPGNGVQRVDMGRALVDAFPWAKMLLREAQATIDGLGGPSFSGVIHPDGPGGEHRDEGNRSKHLSSLGASGLAIVVSSALWERYLAIIGIRPAAICGHSQGELVAFYSAGAIDFAALMRSALYMSRAGSSEYNNGASMGMAVLRCSSSEAETLLAESEGYAAVATINSPNQITLAGEASAVEHCLRLSSERGIEAQRLPSPQAFHTRIIAQGLRYMVDECPPVPPVASIRAPLFSGLDASRIAPGTRPLEYFQRMGGNQVNFDRLARVLSERIELMIEVGPGRSLSRMVADINPGFTCVPLEPKPLHSRAMHVLGAALFAYGVPVRWDVFLTMSRRAWGSAQRQA